MSCLIYEVVRCHRDRDFKIRWTESDVACIGGRLHKHFTISTNASSKNNSKSLRGVPMSFSLLHFGMFACSTILISLFPRFIFKTGGFGQLRTLCNLSLFRTLTYSDPWYIQNPDIFRMLRNSQNGALCKKTMVPGSFGGREFWYTYFQVYLNELAYLQLMTVLVYWNSPPKSLEQSYLNF